MWDAEVSQVQLHIGLYAKSSYRGFLVAPYDTVCTVRGVAIEIGASASSSRFLFRRGKSGEPAADFYKRFLPKFSSALRAGHYTV